MSSIRQHVEDLNAMILGADILGAFEKYYGEEVTMQDNERDLRVGKQTCRQFEEEFVKNLSEFSGASVKNIMVSENAGVAAIEWNFDYTHKEWGERQYTQVALQRWKDDKIISEKFMYKD